KDAAGNTSGMSSALSAKTADCSSGGDVTSPSTPTGLAAGASTETSITFSWTASTDNVGVTGYNVYRGGSMVGSSPTTAYTAGGLTCGTSYSFAVKAKDAAGNLSAMSGALGASTAACLTSGNPANGGWLIRSASDDGATTYTGSMMDDPIVFPGQPGASHMHDFFCNKATDAFSTYAQMIAAPTSCPSGDTAGYWAPGLYKNGVKINPTGSGIR